MRLRAPAVMLNCFITQNAPRSVKEELSCKYNDNYNKILYEAQPTQLNLTITRLIPQMTPGTYPQAQYFLCNTICVWTLFINHLYRHCQRSRSTKNFSTELVNTRYPGMYIYILNTALDAEFKSFLSSKQLFTVKIYALTKISKTTLKYYIW